MYCEARESRFNVVEGCITRKVEGQNINKEIRGTIFLIDLYQLIKRRNDKLYTEAAITGNA